MASTTIPMSRISEFALKKAANSIRTELGTLDDFPKELVNTIANVYYLQFVLLQAANGQRGLLDPYIGAPTGNFTTSFQKLSSLQAESLANSSTVRQYVDALKEMRKVVASMQGANSSTAKMIYDHSVVTTLDSLKYGIDNATRKTPMRRAIERRFKEPREIANLVDLMDEAGFAIFGSGMDGTEDPRQAPPSPTQRHVEFANWVTCPTCKTNISRAAGQIDFKCLNCGTVFRETSGQLERQTPTGPAEVMTKVWTKVCAKCGYERLPSDAGLAHVCPKCGIIYPL